MMKRREPPVVNPVYPYEVKRINLMPPFYDANGFTEETEGALSLKISDPFSFSEKGNLQLKLGNGLRIDNDGDLETDAKSASLATQLPLHVNVHEVLELLYSESDGLYLNENSLAVNLNPPLIFTDKKISLNMDNSLMVENKTLKIKFIPPFTLTDYGLGISLGTGLTIKESSLEVVFPTGQSPIVAESGKIKLNLGQGLITTNNLLQLNVNSPFSLLNNKLQLNVSNGLQIVNDKLTLNYGDGLTFVNDKLQILTDDTSGLQLLNKALQINVGDGMQIQDNKLTIKLGKGLILDADKNISIASFNITFTPPLFFQNNTVSLRYDTLFTINENGLLNLKISKGLNKSVTDGTLNVLLGDGMQFSDNAIVPSLGKGIQLNNKKIEIFCGKGLELLSTGQLQVKLGKGLVFGSSNEIFPSIALKLGNGLEQINGGAISAKVGDGLQFSAHKEIIPNLGDGLEIANKKIKVKVGEGLVLNNTGIKMLQMPNVVWTGADMNNNVFENQGRIFLYLHSYHALVTGLIQIYFPIAKVNESHIEFALYFGADGSLLSSSDLTVDHWIPKTNFPSNSMLQFMPNKNIYMRDREQLNYQGMNYMTILTYFNSSQKNNVLGTVKINFNVEQSSVYSLVFRWGPVAGTEFTDEFIWTSMCQFSYIAEQ
ncbi:fiber [Bat mastadenovirus WIV12]|uniref:Fiber n=1 Tax=Bat mastadenovirus WIV12 TaxID=1788434 RepID=A0A1B0UI17_9ADEN|nr:fiber [Bat mastadenovirus WIV12]AMB43166.1 fiber [Bat mastadenovirus WIV12]